MKKLLLIGALAWLTFTDSSAQVPNSDFENWTFYGWFYNPDYWSTNNNQIQATFVSPDSDAYNGMLAMKLYNHNNIRPVAKTTFPVSSKVSSIDFYARLNLINNDTVWALVKVYENGIVVDTGNWFGTTSINNYTLINVPVSQNSVNADSVEIEFKGGNQTNLIFEGTSFTVDGITGNMTSGIDEVFQHGIVFTNTNGFLNLKAEHALYQPEIKIYNVQGQLSNCSVELSGLNEIVADVRTLSKGIYILELTFNQTKFAARFVIL